jgi:hypothetical protein
MLAGRDAPGPWQKDEVRIMTSRYCSFVALSITPVRPDSSGNAVFMTIKKLWMCRPLRE